MKNTSILGGSTPTAQRPSGGEGRLHSSTGRTWLLRAGSFAVMLTLVFEVIGAQRHEAGAASPASCAPDPVLCPERIYVGASVPKLMSDPAALDAVTRATGVSPSVAMTFARFGDRPNTTALKRLTDAGRLPMLTWEPYDYTRPTANPFPLRSIAAGTWDAALRENARALAAVDAPVAIRFAHEMNGNWYPWGQRVNGNTAADYVAAYRHVHDVVTAAGASNVIWVWAPNIVEGSSMTSNLAQLYPGPRYVDWVGLDAYFDNTADTFAKLFPPTLRLIDQFASTKPIFVAETAVLPGTNRSAMIRDLMTGLLTTPRIIGFSWFNHVTRADWRIEVDPTAAKALAEQLASPFFGGAGQMHQPAVGAPLAQGAPVVTGAAVAGRTVTSSTGNWLSASDPVTTTNRWYRCSDARSVNSCTSTSTTTAAYKVTRSDARKHLRVAVTASNTAGRTVAWSAATAAVLQAPATPKPPVVDARDRALHVKFPTPPVGATHWRLSISGAAKPLIPVGQKSYWLTGLRNGRSYPLQLKAVTSTAVGHLVSGQTAGRAVPLTAPWKPYVRKSGTSLTMRLPRKVPAGATAWIVTAGSTTRTVSTSVRSVTVKGLIRGRTTTWSLRAAAGSWAGSTGTSRTPAVTGRARPR